ncbi:MAG: NfeD family protein [Deltaproteobacteria bacterium]|jgi:membrane protein implicated in regulation of membrane protease activity|nr:NfeD family protein [Deltaproteobacteria bacterium]
MLEFLSTGKLFWFVLGFVLLILEVVTPGALFFIFFGIGAWIVALLLFFVPQLPIWAQWSIFIVTSLIALLILRKQILKLLNAKKTPVTDSLSEPMVADRYLGQEVDVLADLVPNRPGIVEFNGTQWQAKSRTFIPLGDRARIVELDNLTLWVEPISSQVESSGELSEA